ncbi:Rap1a/Tai family immunity protein [Paracoccus sp. SSJ]|uniref:Rap1a/Tai family immunity protein n=1 Tax=Paracoccus sp. SSJ TaxID=3050636 RepID=UPI003306E233
MRWGVLAVGLALAGPAWGQMMFYDGNKILEWCEASRPSAYSYVSGVVDTFNFIGTRPGEKPEFCIPHGATLRQITDTVCKHIDAFPAARHISAAGLTRGALNIAFPCP